MAEAKSEEIHGSWILIAGTTSSPSSIKTSDKKRENGNYLDGITSDLHNVKNWINNTLGGDDGMNVLDTIVQDMKYLSKWTVLDRIQKCAKKTVTYRDAHIYIYYTGHGEKHTGNWCFADGIISLKEVIDAVESVNSGCTIYIIADCCYSGDWVVELKQYKGKYKRDIYVDAACLPGTVAWDTPNGGMFTLVRIEKKQKKDFKNLSNCLGKLNYVYNWEYTMQC